jgi:hypothetical protein
MNRKKANLPTELSCGYSCNVVPYLGIHDKDGYYTFKQQSIRYNHVGIVNEGRAGHNVKILDNKNKNINNQKGAKMPKEIQFTRKAINLDSLKLDAITQIVDSDSLNVINTLSSKLDEAVDIITLIKKDKDVLQGNYDQANETIKSLETNISSLSDINSPRIQEMITARDSVIAIAKALKVEHDGKDIKTLKCDCIKAASNNADINFDGKTDDYINGRFDSVEKLIQTQIKADGNNKFFTFMKKATDGQVGGNKDYRENFIKKDQSQNRA